MVRKIHENYVLESFLLISMKYAKIAYDVTDDNQNKVFSMISHVLIHFSII